MYYGASIQSLGCSLVDFVCKISTESEEFVRFDDADNLALSVDAILEYLR